MVALALFRSVLGVRPGVQSAAELLRAAGHTVTVVDQYAGRVFDDYEVAGAFAGRIGYPELMRRAVDGVADLPRDLVCAGFSNGGGMAQWVATQRPAVRAVVLMSGVLPLPMIGDPPWPAGVPVQTHYMRADPFLTEGNVADFTRSVHAVGGTVQQYWYNGTGHLFTDASLPAEHDEDAAALLWARVLEFLDHAGADTHSEAPR